MAAENPQADRVEGADPDGRCDRPEEPGDPLAHLSGGLVREGDRQDPLRRNPPHRHEMGEPSRQDAGLPASRAGENQ